MIAELRYVRQYPTNNAYFFGATFGFAFLVGSMAASEATDRDVRAASRTGFLDGPLNSVNHRACHYDALCRLS